MFERYGISSGDLKTERVLLNEKGHLKVINKLTWPDENQENFGVRRFYCNFYTNAAPEELRAMRERIDKRINHNIAETFGVGIIVLELATFIGGD